ncbi:MAG: tetratricopeptide repeat protein, partial [Anaerolineae bacterium]|nr:tetratricopeptide repeat protein [Anaerolineae bacterium]
VRQFSLAIETDPQAEYYYNRGLAYALQEEYKNAVADFSDAIQLDSGYEDAYYNRGMAYYQTGNYRAAVADFNNLLELALDFEDALYQRALAYEALGNTEAALADYEVYLESFEPTYAEEAQTRLDALRAES